MYIGRQKLITEKIIDDTYTEVTLEATQERVPMEDGKIEYQLAEGLDKTEKIVFNTIVLSMIKTEEEGDLAWLRQARTLPIVAGILEVMSKYTMNVSDFEYVIQGVKTSLEHAESIAFRKKSKIHETNETVNTFKDELLS